MTDFPLPRRVDWISRILLGVGCLSLLLGAAAHHEPDAPFSWMFWAFAVAAGLAFASLFAPVRFRAFLVWWL
jgi:hypothetical protein